MSFLRRTSKPFLLAFAACLLPFRPSSGQEPQTRWPRVYRLSASDVAPQLDGNPREPVWMRADSITDFTQRDPDQGQPVSERTVVRFLATDAGLWVGLWAMDRDPSGIRHAQLRRDADFDTDDSFTLAIDSQNDQRSGFLFAVNPNGALNDAEILSFEQQNGRWDGIWDARASINNDGWTAELFIPWQTLRYAPDAKSWGLNMQRFIRRKNEYSLWRSFRRGEGIRFLERQGQLEGLGELPGRARAELRPYFLATQRLADRTFRSDGSDSVTAGAALLGDAGLDVKVGVTNRLTLDLTYNTDFAQAEADQQVVNLSRFPVFFPETRQFFNEAAGIFDFGRIRQTQLFYSRRIGLRSDGTPLPILGGARLTGRAGKQQIGALAVRTGGPEDATDFVARIKRDALGRGYVGAMLQGQSASGAPTSLAGGIDFNFPYIIKDRNLVLLGSAAWSRDSADGRVADYYRVIADYPNDNADIVFRYDRVGNDFNPSLGFVSQSGVQRFAGQITLTPRPRRWGIRRFNFTLPSWNVVTRLNGELDNGDITVRPLGAQFENGVDIQLNLKRNWDVPLEDFEIFPGQIVRAGRYSWNRLEISAEGSEAYAIVPEISASVGEFYDGRSNEVGLKLGIRRAPHVLASLEVEHSAITRGDTSFAASVARIRLDYAVNARLNTTLFAQYDNDNERVSLNSRIRWTRSPGSDLYVVWNSGWPSDLDDGIPWRRPLRGALVLKYVHYLRQ